MKKQIQNDDENLQFQNEAVEPFTWIWLGITIVEGVISGLAGYAAVEFIKTNFNRAEDYSELFRAAITEICITIKQAVDDAFLKEYVSDSEAVRKILRDYGDHQRPQVLFEILPQTYNLVERFKSYETKGFGGLILSCNLHLLTIKALAEVPGNENFKITLEKTCNEYAELLEKSGEIYIGLFKEEIKKNVKCLPWSGHCNGPIIAPPQCPLTNFLLINNVTGERKSFPPNEGKKCVDEANDFLENSVNENEPYTNSLAMIKGYKEFKIT
ncbi:hypothetical protein RE438_30755 (plasmid) [Bacillus wiedmannii]|uniref:hypothetical protein n=1 Tax=Bacillus wiedmannii TaxID=1890302 RepID=UPI00065B7F4D|nr:hypothetical protein [Bacillus wiedmannii]KMP71042.1 hypothetical protein TU62_29645 [Bacillus cereus]WMS85493.1 hypothetical protein RE438_30755 [Bacillus wiedmannii]